MEWIVNYQNYPILNLKYLKGLRNEKIFQETKGLGEAKLEKQSICYHSLVVGKVYKPSFLKLFDIKYK